MHSFLNQLTAKFTSIIYFHSFDSSFDLSIYILLKNLNLCLSIIFSLHDVCRSLMKIITHLLLLKLVSIKESTQSMCIRFTIFIVLIIKICEDLYCCLVFMQILHENLKIFNSFKLMSDAICASFLILI